eukprot:1896539-Pyramimonas_sp.AAC.1
MYLGGGGGGHGRDEEGVADAVRGDVPSQPHPVPAVPERHLCDAPHVRLQDALRHGGPGVGLVVALLLHSNNTQRDITSVTSNRNIKV